MTAKRKVAEKPKRKVAAKKPAPTTDSVIAYKAFGPDWKCRDFQYEIGKTYEHAGDLVMCETGFHACVVPFDCWSYYPHSMNLARVRLETVSDVRQEDSKRVAAKITIEASLTLPDWIRAHVAAVIDLCRSAKAGLASKTEENAAATGYRGHAAATGYSGHAAATGDRGHAAATGYRGHAAATGKHAIAISVGVEATAIAGPDGWLVLAAWEYGADGYELKTVKAAKVGGPEGIKAGVTYQLTTAGEFQEVGATP